MMKLFRFSSQPFSLLALFAIWSTFSPPAFAQQASFSDADYQRHIAKLKQKLPEGDFHIVLQKPFVVIGDDKPEQVKQWATGTVKWTISRLKQRYFAKDPNQIINIWLFKDKQSYERNCKKIVGYEPHTPYGFYTSTRRAIIMNISTGGGTLVHEIVHPFIESNFPDCPSWFNEGLASLYEQCMDKDKVIWGKTNWRLRGLQFEIQSNTLPTFQELCSTTTNEFYDSAKGDNYAQARYLCYFLQERDLLQKYYKSFTKNVKQDPTGYRTLQATLGNPDMGEFNRKWQAYCLKLRFP